MMTDVESTVRKFSKEGKKVTNQGYVVEAQDSLNFFPNFAKQLSNFGLDPPIKDTATEDGGDLQDDNGARRKSLTSNPSRDETLHHKIIVIGQTGVGKSSLCQQFQTSENDDIFQSSEVKYGEDGLASTEVHLELNGMAWRLSFIVMPGMSWLGLVHGDENVQRQVDSYDPSAFTVLYAVDDKPSFSKASQVLAHLQVTGAIQDRTVVLVATKCDLVRARVVATGAGKSLAAKFGVKFIETSSGIGHNVDELLVGIVTQLQLRKERGGVGECGGGGGRSKGDFKKRVKIVMAKIKPTGQSKDSTDIMK